MTAPVYGPPPAPPVAQAVVEPAPAGHVAHYPYQKRPIFGNGVVLGLVLLGVILFFVGIMVVTSATLEQPPSDPDDYDRYQDKVRNEIGGGRIILEIGGLLACIGFFGAAIDNTELDVRIKCGFVSAGVAFIITTLIVLNLFGSMTSI